MKNIKSIVIVLFVVFLSVAEVAVEGLSPACSTRLRGDISVVFQDKNDNYWVGNHLGIAKYDFKGSADITDPFETDVESFYMGEMMLQDAVKKDSIIYAVGAESPNFMKLNINTGETQDLSHLVSHNNSYAENPLLLEGDNLWVGTYGGLFKIDLSNGIDSNSTDDVVETALERTGSFEGLCKDGEGNVWCFTVNPWGTFRISKDMQVDSFNCLSTAFCADPNTGEVWAYVPQEFDSLAELKKYSPELDSFLVVEKMGFGGTMVIDSFGVLWGISQYSDGSDTLYSYDISEASFEKYVWGAEETVLGLDNQGRLLLGYDGKVAWMEENNGNGAVVLNHNRNFSKKISVSQNGRLRLSEPTHISFGVYTARGRCVYKKSGYLKAGKHNLSFFENLPANAYFMRLQVKGCSNAIKTIKLR